MSESERFGALAAGLVDGLLQLSPATATVLGDHRFDDQLETWTRTAVADRLEVLREAWAAVDQIDVDALPLPEAVDLELLRDRIGHETWSLQDDRRHQRDPLRHLPVAALLALTDSGFWGPGVADPAALVGRLGLLPARLETARRVLDDMCPEHVETAQARCRTLRRWLAADGPVAAVAAGLDTARGAALADAATEAEQAVASFERWLGYRLPVSDGDARIGPAAYHALTWFGLDSQVDLEVLLTRIESDLQGVEEEIAELAGRLAAVGAAAGGLSGGPDAVLDDPGELVAGVLLGMAAQHPVSASDLLGQAQFVLTDITARVRELDLVDVPDVDVRLVVVPDRRAAMRWTPCQRPQRFSSSGPSSSGLGGGPAPQVTLQREGDVHALRRAAMHAVLPGHLHEALHSPRSPGTDRVRVLCQSEVLREGWAGYAEDLLAGAGLGLGPGQDDALRLHALLSRLRATVAALVDVRAHAEGLTRQEGLRLLTTRGHLAPADAEAAWRQSMLTPAVLVQHYLGRRQVADLVEALWRQRPTLTEAARHRLVLDHGPVPPRRLAQLLGLD